MGIDQWEWEGMGILIVFPHTSTAKLASIVDVVCEWLSCPSVASTDLI